MRFLRQSLTGLFLVSLTLGVLIYAVFLVQQAMQDRMSRDGRAPSGRERVFAVNVIRAEPQQITPVLQTFGEVQSRRSLELRAATGGTIVELSDAFVEGGVVRAGEVLVRIDPAEAQATLARAQSDVQDAIAEVRDAKRAKILAGDELAAAQEQAALRERAFQRQKDLKSRGVGTETAMEIAELAASSERQAVLSRRQALANADTRIDQSATRRARTDIALNEAKRRLDDTEISAQFAGTLSGVNLVTGGLVSPNERLAQLIDPDALEVSFRVSTRQFGQLLDAQNKLRQGDVRIKMDVFGLDLTAKGTLSRSSAVVGEGQTGRQLIAQMEHAPGLKPGDFVTIEIDEAPLQNVVRLPASALDAASNVLVLGEGDHLVELPVALLRRQGSFVLVRGEGLAGKDVVITRTPVLGAGIGVKPLRGADDMKPQEPEMVQLSAERRAKLIGAVEASERLPEAMKAAILAQLAEESVSATLVNRLESRMGG